MTEETIQNPNIGSDSVTGLAYELGRKHASNFEVDITGKYYNIESSYKSVREKIVHEDDLVHQRLTWLITLNGLVFSALGFTLIAESGSLKVATGQSVVNFVFALNSIRFGLLVVGVGSCVAALMGVIAAYRRISQERLNYYEYVSYLRGIIGSKFNEREKVPWMPRLTGHTKTNKYGMYCGLFVPILIGFSWFIIGWTFVVVFNSKILILIALICQMFVFSVFLFGGFHAYRALEIHRKYDDRILELHDLYDSRDNVGKCGLGQE